MLTRELFGRGWIYYMIQAATAVILLLAVNTSFAGFPMLASIMAKDRFLPRQFASLGDRLVFSNGILILAGLSCVLLVLFGGSTHALIPLYAIGVFTAFTLSQTGMVVHWWRERGPRWHAPRRRQRPRRRRHCRGGTGHRRHQVHPRRLDRHHHHSR